MRFRDDHVPDEEHIYCQTENNECEQPSWFFLNANVREVLVADDIGSGYSGKHAVRSPGDWGTVSRSLACSLQFNRFMRESAQKEFLSQACGDAPGRTDRKIR